MNVIELITKKRDGGILSSGELGFLISEYVDERIPDYQMAAFLMAVYFQGMDFDETRTFTQLMRMSGSVLDLSDVHGLKSDKHSTGGVGDKVSVILAPLVASAGMIVPMMSGRALAHTGGTLDKLEAIPGFRTDLGLQRMKTQLQKLGVALIGQTNDICPADKKIYALRDATATVNSIPLITASILSKKLAEDLDVLVLDVKAGAGAIFEEKEMAWKLARSLVRTAEKFGLQTAAVLTNMEQPLGNAVGNWLETKEAIETLHGNGPPDLVEVTLNLAAHMLLLGNLVGSLAEGKSVLAAKLRSGEAYEKFLEIVDAQGGDRSVVEDPAKYPAAKHAKQIIANRSGVISAINARIIGMQSMALGAGRNSMHDKIDYTAGIQLQKKVGDQVAEGDVLAVAYSAKQERLEQHHSAIVSAFKIVEENIEPEPLILGTVDALGEQKFEDRKRGAGAA